MPLLPSVLHFLPLNFDLFVLEILNFIPQVYFLFSSIPCSHIHLFWSLFFLPHHASWFVFVLGFATQTRLSFSRLFLLRVSLRFFCYGICFGQKGFFRGARAREMERERERKVPEGKDNAWEMGFFCVLPALLMFLFCVCVCACMRWGLGLLYVAVLRVSCVLLVVLCSVVFSLALNLYLALKIMFELWVSEWIVHVVSGVHVLCECECKRVIVRVLFCFMGTVVVMMSTLSRPNMNVKILWFIQKMSLE